MRHSAVRATLAALLLVACSVDYEADQAEYDRRKCEVQPFACASAGSAADGGAAGTYGGFGGSTAGTGAEAGSAGYAGSAGGPCVNDELRCNDDSAEQCIDGIWTATLCEEPTPACELGLCVECVTDSGRCVDDVPQLCVGNLWEEQAACEGQSVCQAGVCVTPPSCAALSADCGPAGDESCCASVLVSGGMFYRVNSAMYPATVSDFKLDKYEITVGRFRKFLASYPDNKPAAGDGAHPNIEGSGWDSTWDVNLALTSGILAANTKCDTSYATWTDTAGANENKPINCLDWYTAFAFCAWDGGFLPTDLEFNYAAAGGEEQRRYPWGDTDPPADATVAIYNCYYGGSYCMYTVDNVAPVGTATLGVGLWGQYDLSGNIEEWNFDGSDSYPTECVDCVSLSDYYRVLRGGSFNSYSSTYLLTTYVNSMSPTTLSSTTGARCARAP